MRNQTRVFHKGVHSIGGGVQRWELITVLLSLEICLLFTAKFCIYDAEELVNSHNSSVGKNVNQATIIIVSSIDYSLQNKKLKKFSFIFLKQKSI